MRATPVALVSLLALACATPVGVTRVDDQTAHRELTGNVLSEGEPSTYSKTQLLRLGLWETYEDTPDAALEALRAGLGGPFESELLFALAELSFDRAQKTGRQDLYLASVVYAHAFVFPESGEPPGRYDARTRIAMDLYNNALALGLAGGEPGSVRLASGEHALPFGVLHIELDEDDLQWGEHRLEVFTRTSDFELRGLRNRYRLPGIGAPLSAGLDIRNLPPDTSRSLRIAPRMQVPVTLLLRIEQPLRAAATGEVSGRLELFTDFTEPSAEFDGRRVPLEIDPSAALAFQLDGAPIWAFELRGYLSGAFQAGQDGLYALAPYRPGRIPVVFVHGTASSPARWAEMVNEIEGDPTLNSRYQVWLFLYNTGNPILYSASLLRQALLGAVAELDPEGRDPALRRMVVIGHSQGGLLTRLVATDGGDRIWKHVSNTSIDELDVKPETRELLRKVMYFEAVPGVKRVVFISTPHRGSFLAGQRLGAFAARLVTMPLRLAGVGADLILNQDALKERAVTGRLPTSVDNMNPSSPFVSGLAETWVAPGVAAHSIIAVDDEGPPWSGKNDGVVAYDSAHVEGVESELVVHSTHSTQGTPATIEEVRRILRLHLESQ
jgi:pimeloyl-ACP methyl ester carboxylesterase